MRGARHASGREEELFGEEATEVSDDSAVASEQRLALLLHAREDFQRMTSLLPVVARVSQIPVYTKLFIRCTARLSCLHHGCAKSCTR